MSRIRSIKPDFFRHEALQDLEVSNPGSYVMLVYAGLWTQCDKNGVFMWRPRQLKLDILPFINFDMNKTLDILSDSGQVIKYTADGKELGFIPTFKKHQRISGKEAQETGKHPLPNSEAQEKQPGSNREATENNNHAISQGEATGKQPGSERDQTGAQEKEWSMGMGKGMDNIPGDPQKDETVITPTMSEAIPIAQLMYDKILIIDPKFKASESKLKGWAADIEKLIRLDARSPDEIKAVVEWVYQDQFWKGNILSGGKLREKFTQLLAQMQRKNGNAGRFTNGEDFRRKYEAGEI